MSNAKYDVDMDEFAEVGMDDINTDMDFDMGLEIPEGFDFKQFLQPVQEVPATPETPLRPTAKPNSATFHRDKKMPSTTKKPNQNRAEDQKNLEEWGFTKIEV